ncbi:hypothetical protein Pelo_18831 [Pelomyxa schiedti]|nr:hypothetical protein Pelo_18831 [Pelomyxa schiedti]
MMSILVICQWPLSKRVFDCHLSEIISNFVEDSLPACLLRGEDALCVSMFTRRLVLHGFHLPHCRNNAGPVPHSFYAPGEVTLGKSGVSVEVALSDQNHLCELSPYPATHATSDDTEAELINNEEMLTLLHSNNTTTEIRLNSRVASGRNIDWKLVEWFVGGEIILFRFAEELRKKVIPMLESESLVVWIVAGYKVT